MAVVQNADERRGDEHDPVKPSRPSFAPLVHVLLGEPNRDHDGRECHANSGRSQQIARRDVAGSGDTPSDAYAKFTTWTTQIGTAQRLLTVAEVAEELRAEDPPGE